MKRPCRWLLSALVPLVVGSVACKPEAAVDSPPAAPDCEDDTDGGPTVDSADPGPVAAAGRALIWARIRTAEGEHSVPWRGAQVFVEDSSGRIAQAALTDLHGAVRLPLEDAEGRGLAPGPARLWVEKDGMRLEAAEGPTLGEEGGHLGAFTVDLPEGAVAGRLALRDGSPCIWSFPEFEVEGEGRVWAVDGEGATLTAGALAAEICACLQNAVQRRSRPSWSATAPTRPGWS
jgi:hypothetical protein